MYITYGKVFGGLQIFFSFFFFLKMEALQSELLTVVLSWFGRSHRVPTVTIGPRVRFVGTGKPMKIM